MSKGNLIRAVLGFGVLLLGAMEYVLNRPLDSTYLGTVAKGFTGSFLLKIDIFGNLSGVVPDFAHPFCFALLTMALFPKDVRKIRGLICLFWLGVDVLFEIGQFFGQDIALFIPTILPTGIFTNLLTDYFVVGTYDPIDLLAIWLGVTAAFVIGELTANKGGAENDSGKRNQKNDKRLTTVS